MNLILEKFNKKQMSVLIVLGFVFLSLFPTILMNDPFHLMKGYSAFWLMYLYLVGGYINKYKVFSSGNSLDYIVYYVCLVLFTFLSKVVIETITLRVFGEIKYNLMFVEYTSPTILLCGVFLVVAFSKMNVNKISKLIACLAPLSFSVYLIHNNPTILNKFWNGAFSCLSNHSLVVMILLVIGCSLVVYIGCSMIDLIRCYLFKLFRVKERIYKLENKYIKDLF